MILYGKKYHTQYTRYAEKNKYLFRIIRYAGKQLYNANQIFKIHSKMNTWFPRNALFLSGQIITGDEKYFSPSAP